ncbi:flagellar basal body rod protein FlgB [Pseudobacteriovorax antillogorgiicola]|uniref:Flagellar basal body rod protein FlgB n=1 Tax=Pseudobacteriovorax antillogorgiicola TaxID=1513793 RepID=A0A1Y6CKI1_9BACT|nr:flagellar basal body rod protein FlgB [Pseudobacteriovorax antillogorgiicola]TCS46112.1 flagellar basal-body rod protein FlgB [Pseudobacteriovorax antillogorgiicola]SMF69467.1 flagellar basal-body rod protein FlgB [Pseudobacteriovorax antillogorgiicola]
MSQLAGVFNFSDAIKMEALNQRLTRQHVLTSNIANSETPGYRALGFDFEKQLQAIADGGDPFPMKASSSKHFMNGHTEADGTIYPDVFVRPTESVGQDGNTVDIDDEMSKLSKNQILYRATVELVNRKIGTLKYAISAGGR